MFCLRNKENSFQLRTLIWGPGSVGSKQLLKLGTLTAIIVGVDNLNCHQPKGSKTFIMILCYFFKQLNNAKDLIQPATDKHFIALSIKVRYLLV